MNSPDEQQFLELINENRPRILKVCRVYAGNTADRDDLYQEILFQIWRALPGLKQDTHANTWLYRIAINTSISFIRRRAARGGPAVALDHEQLTHHIESRQTRDDGAEEQLARLYDAIALLNEVEKALVTLFLEDFSYDEMAEVLGLSASNVGVMLHRAKEETFNLDAGGSMNDDALKKLWQEQKFRSLPALPDEAQIAAMKTKMKGFDETIRWRDYGEVVACIFIVGWFGWDLLFRRNSTLTQAGCVVLIVSAVFIAWKLIWSKRRLPKPEANAPIFDAVKVELQKVENQIGLLKSVAWWYLLPLFVGVILFNWGGPGSFPSKLTYFAVVLGLYVFIYWLNQWTVKKNLLPLKQELASLLHSAETGEPLDETHIASLRRIARSMRATDQVKPAEFKVAFWQLAIYGVPGIVGIWFFWMLARTEGNIPRIFLPQHLLWGVLSFLGGLIYTWLIQKTVKRAVGISPLGIHLQNGMNLILWDEIKEVRPFRVLNIQNLWLIKQSGEKTRMHWTPLERHSDVKAAVEQFAPANHPIRQYLSLLRTESSKKNIMTKTILIGIVLISLGAIVFVRGSGPKILAIEYSDPVSQILETIRVKHNLPALAAAVVVDGKIVVTNAVGFRKSGGPEKVAVDDKFHLGSVTKSMTATVAAMLVEQGKISWTTTIGEAFPELKSEIHPDYLGVTLEQLLSHRSGAPGDAPDDLWVARDGDAGWRRSQR